MEKKRDALPPPPLQLEDLHVDLFGQIVAYVIDWLVVPSVHDGHVFGAADAYQHPLLGAAIPLAHRSAGIDARTPAMILEAPEYLYHDGVPLLPKDGPDAVDHMECSMGFRKLVPSYRRAAWHLLNLSRCAKWVARRLDHALWPRFYAQIKPLVQLVDTLGDMGRIEMAT